MDKSKLSEADICEKFISPALAAAGWSIHEQVLREYPLRPGRIVVRGQKSRRDKKSVLRADYVLFWKANIPLAVIEAKDNTQAAGTGMQQAPCLDQNHLIRVRCFEPRCIEFIKLFLNSSSGKDEMRRPAITTSGLFNLSVGKIRSFAIPLPPLPEQERIANRLRQLRHLCNDLRQRLAAGRATQSSLANALIESAI